MQNKKCRNHFGTPGKCCLKQTLFGVSDESSRFVEYSTRFRSPLQIDLFNDLREQIYWQSEIKTSLFNCSLSSYQRNRHVIVVQDSIPPLAIQIYYFKPRQKQIEI